MFRNPKSKLEIKGILKYYFDEDYLADYLHFYEESFKTDEGEMLYNEISRIEHAYLVENDAIHLLTFGLKKIIEGHNEESSKREIARYKSDVKWDLKIFDLRREIINNGRNSSVTITFNNNSVTSSSPEFIDSIRENLENEILRQWHDSNLLPEEKQHWINQIHEALEATLGKMADPLSLIISEFAFSVFKYLVDEKIFIESEPRSTFITRENKKSPQIDHIKFIIRLFQLANAQIEPKDNGLKGEIEKADISNLKMRDQLPNNIKRRISFCRNWLEKGVYAFD